MYTLYFMPGACSLATQVILRELGQPFKLVNKDTADSYKSVNPVGAVPALVDSEEVLREGAAIILYLLQKHENALMAKEGDKKLSDIQNLMFANATVHPAYGRLFFIGGNLEDGEAKEKLFTAAASAINNLWEVVEEQLSNKPFLGGDSYSAADILLTVYHSWGQYFPVEIKVGAKTQKMLDAVSSLKNFKLSQEAEKLPTSEVA